MFMNQFSYEIVYKKGRLHTNADGLSRMTFEPVEIPTPTVTDNLTDDNFMNAMDLKMSERDFSSWMIKLANKNREDYRLGMKLQNYTMAIEMAVETLINCEAEGALCSHSEELKNIDPQSQGSVDPRSRRSADLTAGTKCEQLRFELSCGSISSVLIKNDSEAGDINTLLVEPQQRGTLNLINQEIIAPE